MRAFPEKLLWMDTNLLGWTRIYSDEAPFSCDAETPQKGFSDELLGGSSRARWKLLGRTSRRNSLEGLPVRGGEYSCEAEGSRANEPTPRNSSGTEKQLRQVKFSLENIAFQT
jgi:hypothetical protein